MARPIDYGEPKPWTAERILLRVGALLLLAVLGEELAEIL